MTIGAIYSLCISPIQNWAVVQNGIVNRWAGISYFDMHLSLSFSSKDGARISVVFFLHSIIFVDLLSEPRVTCRLDHRVTVTWSSTCTSLISGLGIWLFASFIRCPEGRLEQECLAFGEDDILSPGLICVPTSFFMIGLEIMEVASVWPWSLSSVLRVERYKIDFRQNKTAQCIIHSAQNGKTFYFNFEPFPTCSSQVRHKQHICSMVVCLYPTAYYILF